MKYKTIAEKMQAVITSGELVPGAILPPISELAKQYKTTYSTMSRVIGLLKNRGLIEYAYEREARYKVVGGDIIDRLRTLRIDELIHGYVKSIKDLGYSAKEAGEFIRKYLEIYGEA
jgi:DNA-binding transcriptional regulator YhcF (GntR family)